MRSNIVAKSQDHSKINFQFFLNYLIQYLSDWKHVASKTKQCCARNCYKKTNPIRWRFMDDIVKYWHIQRESSLEH